MPYTPPENDAVNFALTEHTPVIVNGVDAALAEYSPPANDEVDFSFSVYTARIANGINFELAGEAPSYYGILKRWTGTVWAKEALVVYTGGGWQSKPLKRWSGAEWLLIDTSGV